jgi:hypothetical protein
MQPYQPSINNKGNVLKIYAEEIMSDTRKELNPSVPLLFISAPTLYHRISAPNCGNKKMNFEKKTVVL